MKTWTVVVEITESDSADSRLTKAGIEAFVSGALSMSGRTYLTWQIFECTEAPYGPQGVVLQTSGPQCKNCGALTTYARVNSHGLCMKCETEATNILGRAGRVQTAPKKGGK